FPRPTPLLFLSDLPYFRYISKDIEKYVFRYIVFHPGSLVRGRNQLNRKGGLAAMYNRMRRIFLALGVALPLIAVVPVSHAIQLFWNYGALFCNVNTDTNTGFARIFPPGGTSPTWMWWQAKVHHFDASGVYRGFEWTDSFAYQPPGLLVGGGWFASTNLSN